MYGILNVYIVYHMIPLEFSVTSKINNIFDVFKHKVVFVRIHITKVTYISTYM